MNDETISRGHLKLKANVVVSDLISSLIKTETSSVLIFLSAEGVEASAEGEEINGKVELSLSCPCSLSEREVEELLETVGIKRAEVRLKTTFVRSEGCRSCEIAAILAAFYSTGKGLDVMRELDVSPELKAALSSSLFGGLNIYSLKGKYPALIRYFYPGELLRVIVLKEPKFSGEIIVDKGSLYDFIEGLSLLYAGDGEEGTRALVTASRTMLKDLVIAEDITDLPLFPSSSGSFMLLPSTTSCSSYVMNIGSRASEFIKKRGEAKITRLSRGATVIVQ
ncbi:MAG: hypothetical protein ACP5O5_00885 [Fervidicoccaceae archaeon]